MEKGTVLCVTVKGKLSWALKKTAWTFQVWLKAASMQGKTARIWRAFGGERDHSRKKSRFRERKVAKKPGMVPQTNLLKCMRSSWQFPFKLLIYPKIFGLIFMWTLKNSRPSFNVYLSDTRIYLTLKHHQHYIDWNCRLSSTHVARTNQSYTS